MFPDGWKTGGGSQHKSIFIQNGPEVRRTGEGERAGEKEGEFRVLCLMLETLWVIRVQGEALPGRSIVRGKGVKFGPGATSIKPHARRGTGRRRMEFQSTKMRGPVDLEEGRSWWPW
jgi:hypothetical protein